jgi:hypothetical protein
MQGFFSVLLWEGGRSEAIMIELQSLAWVLVLMGAASLQIPVVLLLVQTGAWS